MKLSMIIGIFVIIAAISGCGGTKWGIFNDGKFSISYPVLNMGNDLNENLILHTGNSQCQLLLNRYSGQSDVKGFASYVKDLMAKQSAATILSDDIQNSYADLGLRVIYNNQPYTSKVRIISCEGNIYEIMINCQESSYEKNSQMVDSVISSMKCVE